MYACFCWLQPETKTLADTLTCACPESEYGTKSLLAVSVTDLLQKGNTDRGMHLCSTYCWLFFGLLNLHGQFVL